MSFFSKLFAGSFEYVKPKEQSTLKIVVVLDESGSMQCIRDDMIKGINDFVTEQKQVDGKPATFTLVKFNQNINRVIKDKPLEKVEELNHMSYSPNGMTALYDAIGDTIGWFKNDRDVLMVIVTDGQENSSKRYKRHQITKMIEDREKEYGWTYVYLSNDLTTSKQGFSLGLDCSDYSANCTVSQEHYGSFLSKDLCTAVKNYRNSGVSVQQQMNAKYCGR